MMKRLEDLTLLYVEDEITTLLIYEKYFKNKFKALYTARDSVKALEIYEKNKPDVIILDINIPGINGLELAKCIKKINNNSKIIMLTARNDKETLLEAIELNLLTYLEKPLNRIKMKNLLEKIEDSFRIDKYLVIYEDGINNLLWNDSKKYLLKNSEIIKLTKKETLLIDLFIMNFSTVITFEMIYNHIYQEDDYKDFSIPAIKTLIKNLRSKLPYLNIKSSYGTGFILDNYEKNY